MSGSRLPAQTITAAAVGYLLLALAVTFPLVLHLDRVLHDLGDPLLSTTLLWWNAHVWPLTDTWWNGPWFYPAAGSLAFSDPRLGASLMATPLQWLGASPLVAYNLTLLASFPMCAMAAFLLAWQLTKRVDAALLAGLVYGFNPYRLAHIEHLELLLAWGMPLALYALHRFVEARETRRRRWLVMLAVVLALQGLSSSYYLLFFAILMAAWLVWFISWRDHRALVSIATASLIGVAVLAPIYIGMWRVHQQYAFDRSSEVENFSADVSSYLTASPLVALWGWTGRFDGVGERQAFPGLTVVLLVVVGSVLAMRRRPMTRARGSAISRACWGLASVVLMVGCAALLWGPFDWRAGPIRLTITDFHKTFSIVVLLATIGLAFSARFRDAYRRRSLLAFYVLATVLLVFCSLGPKPRLFGYEFIYQPPYAWLMVLPGFAEAIRVPARFAMAVVLTLSMAGALAYAQLTYDWRRRSALAAGLLILVAIESWPRQMPLIDPPAPWHADVADVTAVLELPLGLVEYDSTAMYRSMQHRLPTINGMSGAAPPHYRALGRALLDGDASGLTALGSIGPILVAARNDVGEGDAWTPRLDAMPSARRIGRDGIWTFYRLTPMTAPVIVPQLEPRVEPRIEPSGGTAVTPGAACSGRPLVPVAIQNETGAVALSLVTDGNPATVWVSRFSPPYSEVLTIDLGSPQKTCGLALSLGALAYAYPQQLTIEASDDGANWRTVNESPLAALAIAAALRNQRDARIEIGLPDVEARWLRLRRVASEKAPVWVLGELTLKGR